MRGLALGALLLTGCLTVEPGEGVLVCGGDEECPEGWVCSAGACYSEMRCVESFEIPDAIVFRTDDPGWVRTEAEHHTGVASSRPIEGLGPSSAAWMSASFTAPRARVISLWYRMESEESFDLFHVEVDGVEVLSDSGAQGWTSWTYGVSAGSHTLALGYTKDSSVDFGADTVWVDDVDLGCP